MNQAIRWMATNHVAANLLMFVFIVGGLIKTGSLKQEVFPEITMDMIQVSVQYPGAGPDEVEEGIILKIEDSLTGVNGIKELTSVAAENVGVVNAELENDQDPDVALQDIKSEVDRIITFPQRAEKPIITKLLNLREVISIAISGDVSPVTLREQAELIRDELLTFPEITQVKLSGVKNYEIAVEIAEESLRRYGLSLPQIASAISQSSLDLPAGNIKTQGGEILLRTKEKKYTAKEYGDIVILSDARGQLIRLKDLGAVRDTFEESDMTATFDALSAAMVQVYRVGDQKPTEISDVVKAYVAKKQQGLPDSLHLDVWNDSTVLLRGRMDLLIKNAKLGLLLVLVVLGLFLEFRLALWVMLGIPISFFGAMLFLPIFDVSVNMITLFAFILALGILVDDAIVVGEAIFDQRTKGKDYATAALDGVLEVAGPVIFSVLTTIAAFSPLLAIDGVMGKLILSIPLVVIALLAVSLVESLFVLPAHLSGGDNGGFFSRVFRPLERLRLFFGTQLQRLIDGPYQRLLHWCLTYRYVIAAFGVATMMITFGIIKGGIIRFSFMPDVEGDMIRVALRMPPGTPIETTQDYANRLIQKGMSTLKSLEEQHPKGPLLEHIYAVIGGTIPTGGPTGGKAENANHLCDIMMMLTESEQRSMTTQTVIDAWRQAVGPLAGIDSLTFSSNLMNMGADVNIQLAHVNFATLEEASEKLKRELGSFPGVEDLQDSYVPGKEELIIELTPEGRSLGLTEADLANQVRAAFYGAEALRLQIGRNEVKVMVRYPLEDRKDLAILNQMRIRLPLGGELPFDRAAKATLDRGYAKIDRSDRKRVINVTAKVNDAKGNAGEILSTFKQGFLPELVNRYPGLSYTFKGEEKERMEVMTSGVSGFLLALLAIFALMAIPFKSYFQPVLIMIAIPFGLVGAVIGHLVMGYEMSMLSFFGIIALSGVVVNDSLILIDKINRTRREGSPLREAILAGGMRRFRPILLTSLTTFFGLMPMILETSVQAKFLIPMAISLGFGIMFATGITLFLIPATYHILEDAQMWLTGKHSIEPE